MFSDPLVAHYDASGAETHYNYVLMKLGANESLRHCNVSVDADHFPHILRFSHNVVGKGIGTRDRHLIKFEQELVDINGVPAPSAFLYAVADYPRANFSAAQQDVLVRQFVGTIRGGGGDAFNCIDGTLFWDRFIAGEM